MSGDGLVLISQIETSTKLCLTAAGIFFLWALLLGVLKWRQMLASEDRSAHPYTDIAHRSALLYSFALILIALFSYLSELASGIEIAAVLVLIFFFFVSVASYNLHGLRQQTTNQFVEPSRSLQIVMPLLVVGEIAAFAILLLSALSALWA